MNIDSRLFTYIAGHIPQLWEIVGGGPLGLRPAGAIAAAELNPQPLPPHAAFALGASLAGEFLRAAWTADRFGLDMGRLMDELDDWCPTQPRKPKPPPQSWPPIPDPDPDPRWFGALHAGFATRLAAAEIGPKDHRLRESVEAALKRSLDILGDRKG